MKTIDLEQVDLIVGRVTPFGLTRAEVIFDVRISKTESDRSGAGFYSPSKGIDIIIPAECADQFKPGDIFSFKKIN